MIAMPVDKTNVKTNRIKSEPDCSISGEEIESLDSLFKQRINLSCRPSGDHLTPLGFNIDQLHIKTEPKQEYVYDVTNTEEYILGVSHTSRSIQFEPELHSGLIVAQPGNLENLKCEINEGNETDASHNVRYNLLSDIQNNLTRIGYSNVVHPCLHCKKTFSCFEDLKKHHLTHERVQMTNNCLHCGKTFPDIIELKNHVKNHTFLRSFQKFQGTIFFNSFFRCEKFLYKCNHCARYFPSKVELIKHEKEHAEEILNLSLDSIDISSFSECSQCGMSFTKQDTFIEHCLSHSVGNSNKCPDCGMMFAQKAYLIKHMSKFRLRPHKCTRCCRAFSQMCQLIRHKLSHNFEHSNQCSDCGKVFGRKSNLITHAIIHSGEKPFKCTLCGKSFVQEAQLKRHIFLQKGEKPHRCVFCGKTFTLKFNMTKHMLVHSKEKPHNCKRCRKSFALKKLLDKHISTCSRTYHECRKCGKKFKLKKYLDAHMLFHSGKKPYKCSQCEKAYTIKAHLLRHNVIHTGEKYYECCHCGEAFLKQYDLNMHVPSHFE